jgi:molybdopterin-guanine dinucleotide biosynthesis protein A
MAARVADALRAAGCLSVVAIGGDVDEISTLGLAIVPDVDPGGGPLAGVLTALETVLAASTGSETPDWVCVLACDLPGLDANTVLRLAAAAQDHPAADAVVARTERLEPGCALWSTQAAPKVRAMYDGGVRAVHGALDALAVVAVDVDSGPLRNINTPEDLGRYPGPSD